MTGLPSNDQTIPATPIPLISGINHPGPDATVQATNPSCPLTKFKNATRPTDVATPAAAAVSSRAGTPRFKTRLFSPVERSTVPMQGVCQPLEAEPLHASLHRLGRQTEEFGGFGSAAAGPLERLTDEIQLDFLEYHTVLGKLELV